MRENLNVAPKEVLLENVARCLKLIWFLAKNSSLKPGMVGMGADHSLNRSHHGLRRRQYITQTTNVTTNAGEAGEVLNAESKIQVRHRIGLNCVELELEFL